MKRLAFFLLSGFLLAHPAWAALYDLKITSQNITFSREDVLARQSIRVYATVENVGERDAEATLELYDGDRKVGSKALSVRAGGRPDEVWMEWTPASEGNHFLRIKLVSDPDTPDENPDNGTIAMDVFSDRDTDGDGVGDRRDQDDDNDGVLDTSDQFPLDAARSKDIDGDGIDDKVDTDIDNDGLANAEEARLGTDPTRRDTDGDGVGDKEDVYPLDAKRSALEVVKPVVSPSPVPRPVASSAPSPTPSPTSRGMTKEKINPGNDEPSPSPSRLESDQAPDSVVSDVPSLRIEVGSTSDTWVGIHSSGTVIVAQDGTGIDGEPSKQIEETVAATSADQEKRSSIVPILVALAIVSGGIGVGFLLKSRGV